MERLNSYVICLNNNIVYKGVREAERATGADHSNISKVCKGLRCSVKGLRFQYFDPEVHESYNYYSFDPSIN